MLKQTQSLSVKLCLPACGVVGKVGEPLGARVGHNNIGELWSPEGDPGVLTTHLLLSLGRSVNCVCYSHNARDQLQSHLLNCGHSSSYFIHEFKVTGPHKVREQRENTINPSDLMTSTFTLQSLLDQYSNSQRYISSFVWNYCSLLHILISNFQALS